MAKPVAGCELTSEEQHLLTFLRRGPLSVEGVAKALHISPERAQDILHGFHRKGGLVRLFRYATLCYGLAE
jgi:hypothetical protein